MESRGFPIPEGRIVLFEGEHVGPNRGFGALHIWDEHRREMARRGLMSYENVPKFVAAILQAVHRREGPIWSVVTAYAGNKTHVTRIGTVR